MPVVSEPHFRSPDLQCDLEPYNKSAPSLLPPSLLHSSLSYPSPHPHPILLSVNSAEIAGNFCAQYSAFIILRLEKKLFDNNLGYFSHHSKQSHHYCYKGVSSEIRDHLLEVFAASLLPVLWETYFPQLSLTELGKGAGSLEPQSPNL